MIVSSGKSRCQVKRIDDVYYCLNVMTGDDNPIPLNAVYKMIATPKHDRYGDLLCKGISLSVSLTNEFTINRL